MLVMRNITFFTIFEYRNSAHAEANSSLHLKLIAYFVPSIRLISHFLLTGSRHVDTLCVDVCCKAAYANRNEGNEAGTSEFGLGLMANKAWLAINFNFI